MSVLQGEASLGIFLTNVNLFNKVGAAYAQIYKIVVSMQTVLAPLSTITFLLNLPSDVAQRMAIARQNQAISDRMLAEVSAQNVASAKARVGYEADLLQIRIENLSFEYKQQ